MHPPGRNESRLVHADDVAREPTTATGRRNSKTRPAAAVRHYRLFSFLRDVNTVVASRYKAPIWV